MAVMTLDEILEKVKELKAEGSEKDEVIRTQQIQIDELEQKVLDLEKKLQDYEDQVADLSSRAGEAESVLSRLSEELG